MFVQIIKGQVTDSAKARSALDEWVHDFAPGADGWLGTTAGVTREGTFLALARFESPEAAQRNSERTEQDQWWAKTSKLFSGDVAFRDSDDVTMWLDGGSDDAGFVQVMEGRVLDRARADALAKEMEAEMADSRPDLLGGLTAVRPDGSYTDFVYFRSEAEARVGEKQGMPPEMEEQMNQTWAIEAFHDLTDPWLYSR